MQITNHSFCNLQTYMIYFAVNGVVMPVFTYPKTNDSNAATAVDYVNETVVDMQPCNADVLFTGEYIEHPLPALATVQELLYDNLPEMKDAVPFDAANIGLVSGYVADMPTAVSNGQVTTFGLGQSIVSGGPQ